MHPFCIIGKYDPHYYEVAASKIEQPVLDQAHHHEFLSSLVNFLNLIDKYSTISQLFIYKPISRTSKVIKSYDIHRNRMPSSKLQRFCVGYVSCDQTRLAVQPVPGKSRDDSLHATMHTKKRHHPQG